MKPVKLAATLGLLALSATIFSKSAFAGPKEDAISLVSAALNQVSTKGVEAATTEISGNQAMWQKGSTYVFIADFKGNILAHSANPKLVGKNLWEAKDAAGKALIQEQVSVMKSSTTGVVKIRWMNPTTKQVGDADVELRRIAGRELYIGAPWFH